MHASLLLVLLCLSFCLSQHRFSLTSLSSSFRLHSLKPWTATNPQWPPIKQAQSPTLLFGSSPFLSRCFLSFPRQWSVVRQDSVLFRRKSIMDLINVLPIMRSTGIIGIDDGTVLFCQPIGTWVQKSSAKAPIFLGSALHIIRDRHRFEHLVLKCHWNSVWHIEVG